MVVFSAGSGPGPIWACLPILFLAWTGKIYLAKGEGWTLLWLCDICNLMLALGLVFRRLDWVWISTMWLIAGTPLWILDDLSRGTLRPNAVGIHLGSAALGLWAMRSHPRPGRLWPTAVTWLIVAQLVSRLITPSELNVNLAHHVYPALEPWFSSYAPYWVFNVVMFSLAMFILERWLDRWINASRSQADSRGSG